MHYALYIEEIISNIFRLLFQNSDSRRCVNATLAALARTCRTFKEPALDLLWAELDNLSPLVRCLPESCVEATFDVGYSLKKDLEETHWNIILGYASRVRVIACLNRSSGLTEDCIVALSNPPISTSIFPNLCDLSLTSNTKAVPLMRHFASPKLTTISLEGSGLPSAFISIFGEGCPIVTNLHVWKCSNLDSDTISGLVCHWQNLHSVTCPLNADALIHLSHLSNLRSLRCQVRDTVVERIRSSASVLAFPALRVLSLDSCSTSILLRHFSLPVLHELLVQFRVGHDQAAPEVLMPLFTAIQESCSFTSLNKLQIWLESYDTRLAVLGNLSRSCITFDCFRPLTAFVNMKSIKLSISFGGGLKEHELLSLASSWPHLETLEIGMDHGSVSSSGITPRGFLQLLEICRSLRVLNIVLDTRGYTEIPRGHPWRALRMPKHTRINFMNSPIEEESIEALAIFFHVAPYPDFGLITTWDILRGPKLRERDELYLYEDRWEKVELLARTLSEKRQVLRRSLETRSSRCYSQ